MKRFKFTLHTLLKVKETKKKETQMELGNAQKQYKECARDLNIAKQDRSESGIIMEKTMAEGSTPVFIKQYSQYYHDMSKKIKIKTNNLDRLGEQCKDIEERLISNLKEIEILERLKQNQYNKYCYEVERFNERKIDELVSYQRSLGGETNGWG